MTAEIICVGTEILLGNIVNTNAAYLANQCAALGLTCFYQSVVGDNEKRLLDLVHLAMGRSDIIIICGGLGPTQDDITKETVAKAVGLDLVLDENSAQRIREYFEKKGTKIAENNWKQAMIPVGAMVLNNDNGTAPGLIVKHGDVSIILLPGPPIELEHMFEESVKPYLMKLENGVIYSQTLKLCGIAESTVDETIADLESEGNNPTVAPYAKHGEVHIRVTAKAEDEKAAKKLCKPVVRELKSRLGQNIYATHEQDTLEGAVLNLLIANHLTICSAESITAGMIAARLVSVPGASETVKSGFVTYSNKSKRKLLQVKKSTLEKHGAVSEETVREMLKGAAALTKADVVIATSGEAGPEPSENKPVGLVYIGCMICGQMVVKEYNFNGERNKIREMTTTNALMLLRSCVLEYYSEKTFGKQDN
ncbi:MAG: competence/damage-inducible protein A [Lachnospiraceae bacterium]|nr:competence/damage-inducible protein A [Candidatus Merdinaster equi]